MKNNKKTLLGIMVLSAMSLMAADNPIIQVTTFEDQNGEAQFITLEKSLHELLGDTWFFVFNSALEDWFYNCYEKEYNYSDYHNECF